MIYTLTLNPSIDYAVGTDGLYIGSVNKAHSGKLHAGGKGVNVSSVLNNLGAENTALGFLAGFTGEIIKRILDDSGVANDFIFLEKGISRINVQVKSGGTTETGINGAGPEISGEDLEMLYGRLGKLENGDTLVMAGSVPESVGNFIYCDIMDRLSGKDIRLIADASGEPLEKVLSRRPFLVKPNHHELGELLGRKISSPDELEECAVQVRNMGAKNVLASMGSAGAVLAAEDATVRFCSAPEGTLVNSVGSGDSMLAGFLFGLERYKDYEKALYMGVAAGSASAFSEDLAKADEIMTLFESIMRNVNRSVR